MSKSSSSQVWPPPFSLPSWRCSLNRYASTDMRGSAIERSQNRQRKLDGIIRWYFDPVMELLPLMLQVALLLLGCALSRYLWEISVTIASVVLGVTSFGLLSYLLILIAGAIWENCPYQTPGSTFFRHLGPIVWGMVQSAASSFRESEVNRTIRLNVGCYHPFSPEGNTLAFFVSLVEEVPPALATDARSLGRMAIQPLYISTTIAYRFAHRVYIRLRGTSPTPEWRSFHRPTLLDFRCTSWTLRTSLERPVHLSTLKYLVTITDYTNFDSTVAIDLLNIYLGYVNVSNNKVEIMQGLDGLATLSARCLFQAFHHLSATRPTSSALADLRRRYTRIFPFNADFRGLPLYCQMTTIHALVNRSWGHRILGWLDYRPSDQELVPFARHLVGTAHAEYQQAQNKRIPRWILRFALHFLSVNPPPPTSVIVDCLTIIAFALDHNASSILDLDESVRVEQISSVITQKLELIAEAPGEGPTIQSKRKAISSLFPYAARMSQDGQQGMLDAIFRVALKPASGGFMWRRIGPYITHWLDESSPPSLNQAITIASPCAAWIFGSYTQGAVVRWAAAALATPYSEEVGRNVVDALLQIAFERPLRPHVPIEIWAWLKRRPSLPPVSWGRYHGTTLDIVRHVQGLGDIELLKSYFLVVWSEWVVLFTSGCPEMEVLIRQEFCGTGMWRHRQDLIERLDYVFGQLDRGMEYLQQYNPEITKAHIRLARKQYGGLRAALAEVEREAMRTLSQSHTTVACALPLPVP